jgi:glycosyltransferase involved in cell wall biosynthesis
LTTIRIDILRINARLNVGGIARHVTWLTKGLDAFGYRTLLVAGTVPTGEADMQGFVKEQGVEPLILPEMSREISPRDVVAVWKLYRLMLKNRPTIVHTHAAKAGAVGRVAAWFYRWLTPGTLIGRPRFCRVVHTYHGHIFHSYYGRLQTWVFLTIERWLAQLATHRIITISPAQHDEILNRFRVGRASQHRVIPLGIDLTAYENASKRRPVLRREVEATDEELLVGIVGRLTEIKDHHLFLRSIARYRAIASSGMRVRFLVIGDGHLRKELESAAEAHGVKDDVRFLGMRDDPEVFYPALDVVALTSKNEGTPLSVIEGFANGLPVIATNVGGVPDLLGPPCEAAGPSADGVTACERGLLVRPGDDEAFARGLDRLIRDRVLRDSVATAGQAFVHSRYSKTRLLTDIAGLYDDLLGRSATSAGSLSPQAH